MLSLSPIPCSFGFRVQGRAREESAIYSALIGDLGEDHITISIGGMILFMLIDPLCGH